MSLRDILSKIRRINPTDIWPDKDQSEQRIRFMSDPFQEFLLSDIETQAKIIRLA